MTAFRTAMPTAITPILSLNRKAALPLHRQIYDGFRDAILNGALRPGQRVPSTRALASELGVSRIPVLGAYAQLLAEGYFQSRSGAGTNVSLSLPDQGVSADPKRIRSTTSRPDRRPRTIALRASGQNPVANAPWGRGLGAFAIGQIASEHFPLRVWNSLMSRHCRRTSSKALDYGHPLGLTALREAVASYLRTARGVRCDAEQIMIVSGSQQALDVCARVLLESGDQIWLEEPGYRYAQRVFALNGCRIVPVPVDGEGLNVSAGIRKCPGARAALVTPSHQYPLGVTMSASRRLQLLDWAARSGSWILEDDYDSEYRYEGLPIPALQGLDSNARVVYIGTFSKVLFPSLRLGYLVIPSDLVGSFLAVRLAMDIAPATFTQAVLADFIREGHFARHIRRMRVLYRERRNALVSALGKEFGQTIKITGEQAGMHLCIKVDGIPDRKIADCANRSNLWLVPLSSSYAGKTPRHGFILGFASTAASEMAKAVQNLHAALYSRRLGK